jgi:hypothetical protein
MQARYPGFIDYFIVEQHFHRFAGAGFNNAQPWWFFVPVLLVLTFPWSLAAPAVLRNLRTHSRQRSLNLLMVCWVLVTVVFFSIPRSKLIGYALPAAAPLAWLFADALRGLGTRAAMRRHRWTFAGASCVIMFLAIATYSIRAPNSSQLIAAALQEKRKPDEPVVFVGTYPYDLVFQTHLRPPIAVVQQWSDASIDKSDSWQKELLDAARFRPDAGSRALVEQLPVSTEQRTWIVLPSAMQPAPQLHASLVADNTQLSLWMADGPKVTAR